MPYCPSCKVDYDDDVEDCVVCGGPLIDGSSRDSFEEIHEDEWVELDPLPTITHAMSVSTALAEEAIPSYIEAVYGAGGSDGYSASVMIIDNDFEVALEIQQGIAAPDDDDLLLDPDADDF